MRELLLRRRELMAAQKAEKRFILTLSNILAGEQFSFQISATGTFRVEWGDGNIQEIQKTTLGYTTYTHTYQNTGNYDVKFSGRATMYSLSTSEGCISFFSSLNKLKITGIRGTLGDIFPEMANLRFIETFRGCSNLTGSIPQGLFGNLTGAPATAMFNGTFYVCSNLTGIEDGIWNLEGLTDIAATNAFYYFMNGCTKMGTNPISTTPTIKAGSSVKLWEKFTNMGADSAGCFRSCAFSDMAEVPTTWK